MVDGIYHLDGGRMKCVQLILLLQRHVPALPADTIVHLRTEDPIAGIDLPAWCHLTGHEWLGRVPRSSVLSYAIRISGDAARTHPQRPWRVDAASDSDRAEPTEHSTEVPGRPAGLDRSTIYLDYNGTTPVDTRVIDALLPYLHTHFGNPSSSHHYGHVPAAALVRARRDIARLIRADTEQITFTGSGSEADAMAIHGPVAASVHGGAGPPHLITQATEHPAVLAACRDAARTYGGRVTVLPVDGHGRVRPDDLAAALDDDTVLVSIMHANNETGVIQPIAELAAVAHRAGALFHTDAAQSIGKIPVDVADLGVDLLTLVGHKMYAPKGVAALYLRDPGLALQPLVGGGGQERGRRAGTENVPYAVALGTAARLAKQDLDGGQPARLARLRDGLHEVLADALPGRVQVNGHPDHRLPHVLNISIAGVAAHQLLESCPHVAASTGSACHAGRHEPSPVLTAMGQPPERALSALRLTLGRWSTIEDVTRAAADITAAAT